MKKLLTITLLIVLSVSLFACNSQTSDNESKLEQSGGGLNLSVSESESEDSKSELHAKPYPYPDKSPIYDLDSGETVYQFDITPEGSYLVVYRYEVYNFSNELIAEFEANSFSRVAQDNSIWVINRNDELIYCDITGKELETLNAASSILAYDRKNGIMLAIYNQKLCFLDAKGNVEEIEPEADVIAENTKRKAVKFNFDNEDQYVYYAIMCDGKYEYLYSYHNDDIEAIVYNKKYDAFLFGGIDVMAILNRHGEYFTVSCYSDLIDSPLDDKYVIAHAASSLYGTWHLLDGDTLKVLTALPSSAEEYYFNKYGDIVIKVCLDGDKVNYSLAVSPEKLIEKYKDEDHDYLMFDAPPPTAETFK